MACRAGITTNPPERERYWRSQYSSFRNWRLISRHSSRAEAQTKENLIAAQWGCEANPGGGGPEFATWHVYTFEHDGY